MTTENLVDLAGRQLASWDLASRNHEALKRSSRRSLNAGGFGCEVLHNPARIVSTGARVENGKAGDRACFLCAENRPKEQIVLERQDGFEVLVNPFPILDPHFTIVSELHEPQSDVPDEMIRFAKACPGLTAFFNGAKAGASAPDHLHFQAVATRELPLMRIADRLAPRNGRVALSSDVAADVPFLFAMLRGEDEEQMKLIRSIGGINAESGERDPDLRNVFAFIGSDGELITVVIPRMRHRPACYFAQGEERMLVSPGAIDMAGLTVTPRQEDFNRITADDILSIYRQTGVPKEAGADVAISDLICR